MRALDKAVAGARRGGRTNNPSEKPQGESRLDALIQRKRKEPGIVNAQSIPQRGTNDAYGNPFTGLPGNRLAENAVGQTELGPNSVVDASISGTLTKARISGQGTWGKGEISAQGTFTKGEIAAAGTWTKGEISSQGTFTKGEISNTGTWPDNDIPSSIARTSALANKASRSSVSQLEKRVKKLEQGRRK